MNIRLIKLWLPVFVWAGIIFFFSGVPSLKTDFKYDFILRKLAHMTEYFILTLLLYRACKHSFHLNPARLFIYPVSLAILYAVSDELHQAFVPARHCASTDVVIDTVGILGFYIALRIIRK